MKKKQSTIMMAVALSCSLILAGCSGSKNKSATTNQDAVEESTPAVTEDNTEEAEQTFTVTYYDSDATTVLSTEEVKDGECATEYTPEKDGALFMDWYAVKTLSIEYDFTKPVTKDISIYAGFISEQEDTRQFAIVGSGTSPLLLNSAWGNYIDENYYLTKTEGENIYSITLDLYEGDQFQFAINTKWEDQRGAGYLKDNTYNGVQYFDGEGNKSNITCLADGNYTLTLTTYPSADLYDTTSETYSEETKENYNYNPYDTIVFTYNGEVQNKVELQTIYYIKGAKVTEWQDLYEEQYQMTETDQVATLTIDLEKEDEFLFTSLVSDGEITSSGTEFIRFSNITDDESLQYVEGTESDNIVVKETGTYTFTYDTAAKTLSVSYVAK